MDKLHVIQMPETDVRLIVPRDVELVCLASYKKGESTEVECCKLGSGPIEFSLPLMAFVDRLQELPRTAALAAASFAIREIAKVSGMGVVEMSTINDENPEQFEKRLKDFLKNGGEQE